MNAETFNALYKVGIPVFAYPGARPEDIPSATQLVTRTRSKATVLGGHTDVVWVDGHSACIALSHVDVVTEDEWEAAKAAETPAPVAPASSEPLPPGVLAEYAALNLTELLGADAAAVVRPMWDRMVAQIGWLRCELAHARSGRDGGVR